MSIKTKESFFKILSIVSGIELIGMSVLSVIYGILILFGVNQAIPSKIATINGSMSMSTNNDAFVASPIVYKANSGGIFIKILVLLIVAALVYGLIRLAKYIFEQKDMSYQQLIKRKKVYLLLSIITAIGSLVNALFAIFVFLPIISMYILTEINDSEDEDDDD
jgi:hypothetical protein